MTDEQPDVSLRDRLAAAGLSAERIEQHRAAGLIRLDGEPVDDLGCPAPAGTRVVIVGG